MLMNFRLSALLLCLLLIGNGESSGLAAPSPGPVPAPADLPPRTTIYDGPVPDSTGPGDVPYLLAYIPAKGPAPTAAILDFPGGGYAMVSMVNEGENEGAWMRAHGVAVFVLNYRLPHGRSQVPLEDAQRALRWIRQHAPQFNLDPARIGVMGFSAGGHLAATLETHYDAGRPDAADPVERVSCKPDFAVLVYPVITMKEGEAHQHSRDNLLGPQPDAALVAEFSDELHVTPQTPPTILFAAEDDKIVPIQNSRDMYAALQKAGVPSEFQAYPHGGHGFGFGMVPDHSPPGWFDVTLYGWLRKMGVMK